MPAYGKQLSAEQQKSMVQYIRQIAGKTAEAKPEEKKAPAVSEEKKSPEVGQEVKAEEQKALAVSESSRTAEQKAPASGATVSEAAKKEYAKSCASCHGKDGKGNPAMAKVFKVESAALDLVDDGTIGKTDAELVTTISEGRNKMPAYKGKVSDSMIAEIVGYLRSLKAK
jgi:cytochrome c6